MLSGVNHGANMGDDTLYSGTVAAATEAYLLGIPAVAFFAQRFQRPLLGHRQKAVWMMLEHLLKNPPAAFAVECQHPRSGMPKISKAAKSPRLGRRHHVQSIVRHTTRVAKPCIG